MYYFTLSKSELKNNKIKHSLDCSLTHFFVVARSSSLQQKCHDKLSKTCSLLYLFILNNICKQTIINQSKKYLMKCFLTTVFLTNKEIFHNRNMENRRNKIHETAIILVHNNLKNLCFIKQLLKSISKHHWNQSCGNRFARHWRKRCQHKLKTTKIITWKVYNTKQRDARLLYFQMFFSLYRHVKLAQALEWNGMLK